MFPCQLPHTKFASHRSSSTLLEPLTESILCGIIGGCSLRHFSPIPLWLFFFAHMAAWYSLDVSVFRSISISSPAKQLHIPYHDGPGLSGFRIHFLLAWLARELSALPIWLFAMLGNKVSWREDGKLYRVRPDGKVVEANQKDWIDIVAEDVFRRIRGRSSSAVQYGAVSRLDEEST